MGKSLKELEKDLLLDRGFSQLLGAFSTKKPAHSKLSEKEKVETHKKPPINLL